MSKKLIVQPVDFDDLSLKVVEKARLLEAEDFEVVSQLKNELTHTYWNVQRFRTRTEMEVSVLNDVKFPTPESKYWQALREQYVMYKELVWLSFDYETNLIELEKLKRKFKNEKDDLERKLLRVEIRKKKFIKLNHERTGAARVREIRDWHEIMEHWSEFVNKDQLDMGTVNDHQLISYTIRWVKQAMIMGSTGSPAERQNLYGQLDSGLKTCLKRKLLDKVIEVFGKKERQEIMNRIERQGLDK